MTNQQQEIEDAKQEYREQLEREGYDEDLIEEAVRDAFAAHPSLTASERNPSLPW